MDRRVLLLCIIVFFGLVNVLVLISFNFAAPRYLEVTFLDIGQGDAILIETPDGKDILIDGGPDRSVLRRLPGEMGVLDRTLDLVIATHPDKDHIAGLSYVFARYKVASFMEPGVESDSPYAAMLDSRISEEGIERIQARRGMRIRLGENVYVDVLYPDRDVREIETNTGSIVLRLVYGEAEFLLSGDAPSAVEEYVVALDGSALRSDVVKAGHHGSRTSTSEALLSAADPDYVVVSAGKGNSYGHPHEEVLARIDASGAEVLTTFDGPVTFYSDGVSVWNE